MNDDTFTHEANMSKTVYCVAYKGGKPFVRIAELVKTNWSWRTYVDSESGEEWREIGKGSWCDSAEGALRAEVERLAPTDPEWFKIKMLFPNRDDERDLRRLVAVCVLLDAEWKLQASAHPANA